MSLPRRLIAALLAALLASAGGVVHAEDDRADHDRARAALAAGEVLPLATVLERVSRTDPGQVLSVELEHKRGRWVYELKLLRPGGTLARLDVDARTAAVLRTREPR